MSIQQRSGICLLGAIAALGLAIGAGAQVPNAPPARLVNARTLKCSFTIMTTGTWKSGVAEASVKPAKLAVAFSNVNPEDGTADAAADSGRSHITVRVSGNYLHLMQMEPYGALYVTTVFHQETSGGRLQAAHTRHEYTPVSLPAFTSRPEQYIGDCEVAAK